MGAYADAEGLTPGIIKISAGIHSAPPTRTSNGMGFNGGMAKIFSLVSGSGLRV